MFTTLALPPTLVNSIKLCKQYQLLCGHQQLQLLHQRTQIWVSSRHIHAHTYTSANYHVQAKVGSQ